MFEVTLTDGRKVHCHADQLRSRPNSDNNTPVVDRSQEADDDDFDVTIPNSKGVAEPSSMEVGQDTLETQDENDTPRSNDDESNQPHVPSESSPHTSSDGDTVELLPDTSTDTGQPDIRRSNRPRKPPSCYGHSDVVN